MLDKDLKALFDGHSHNLQRYLTRQVKDPQLAADLVQESFLRLAEQPSGSANVLTAAYLYRVARNLMIDHMRQEHRRKTHTFSEEGLEPVVDETTCLETQAIAAQQRQALAAALRALPERTREIVRLNRIEGMTHAEVARQLDISDSSVQKHLAQGLVFIMQRLKEKSY
ncbi:MAG: RNA polymerase sigma factor [Pseudomonas sp.]|uniref:RNA polymerase sigma factor n=1 Tax=Pseudomonas abieticivorans TaxID=2931382 RepID=UPI0020C09F5C|nr:RNA polymerase sigma factor [Pseudomonas sp. PIA16]MDE1168257.1 RNA polymerase sigma factor [Pseudomonas sp.]